MPIEIPTAEDVEQAFEGAVRGAAGSAGALDDQEYTKLFRAATAGWQQAADGVETRQSVGARLFRVTWPFGIDRIADGQKQQLQGQASALRQTLTSVFNGGTVSVIIEKTTVKDIPGGTLVGCSARGIVSP